MTADLLRTRGAVNPPSPAITVLMPFRDAASTIDAAVRSILDQTAPDFELLAVDDRSRDGSAARLRELQRRDSRIRVVPCEGEGLIDALNTGLRAARGALVARFDADDLAHPRRLELQSAFLRRRGNLTVVSCLVTSFPRASVQEGYRIYERWLNALVEPGAIAREIYIESPLPHPSVLFVRDAVLAAGGYRDRGWPEDYDLWLRLHQNGHRFAKVREVLHFWRDDPGRHSRSHPRYSSERFLATKAHYLARGPLRGSPVVVWGAGPISRRLSRRLLAEGTDLRAFIDIDPRKIGRRLRGRPILAPDALGAAGEFVVLAAVGSRHARELIRRRVQSRGFREGLDFFCAA